MALLENLEMQLSARSSSAASSVDRLRSSLEGLKGTTNKSSGAMEKLARSIGRIAFYRVLRSAIRSVTQAFQVGLKNAYNFSKAVGYELANAMDTLATKSLTMKNQLGSALGGLLQAIQPILLRIISLVTQAANALAALFGAFNGGTYLKAKDTATAWDDAAKAAGKYKNTILGFDEINRLDDPSGGGGATGADFNDMFEIKDVPEWAQKTADFVEKLKQKIEENLAAIEYAASAASLAIGLILSLSGANIPLGLGLIAVGAVGMAKALKENWDKIPNKTKEVFAEIGVVVGLGLVAIGTLLAFSGANVPLGIGMIAAGIATVGAVSLAWDKLPNEIQEKVTRLTTIVGAATLAVGAILAFSGAAPALGIGLIAAGAVGLASAAFVNWEQIKQKITGIAGELTLILGGCLLAIGALLVFSGAGTALGIGLLAAGAVSLAASAAINWDFIKEKIDGVVSAVLAILSAAGTVLGILLCLNPATLPIGIGLLYASLKGSTAAFDLDDNSVTRGILKFVGKIESAINTYIIAPLNNVLNVFNQIFGTNWNVGFLNGVASKLNDIGGTTTNNNNFSHSTSSVKKFAAGGIVDQGTLFIAGEAGAEIVSSNGGTTQVSNTDQIAASVQSGNGIVVNAIYAMANAIVNSVDRKDTNPIVTIGDRDVYRAWERGSSAVGGSLVHG